MTKRVSVPSNRVFSRVGQDRAKLPHDTDKVDDGLATRGW